MKNVFFFFNMYCTFIHTIRLKLKILPIRFKSRDKHDFSHSFAFIIQECECQKPRSLFPVHFAYYATHTYPISRIRQPVRVLTFQYIFRAGFSGFPKRVWINDNPSEKNSTSPFTRVYIFYVMRSIFFSAGTNRDGLIYENWMRPTRDFLFFPSAAICDVVGVIW